METSCFHLPELKSELTHKYVNRPLNKKKIPCNTLPFLYIWNKSTLSLNSHIRYWVSKNTEKKWHSLAQLEASLPLTDLHGKFPLLSWYHHFCSWESCLLSFYSKCTVQKTMANQHQLLVCCYDLVSHLFFFSKMKTELPLTVLTYCFKDQSCLFFTFPDFCSCIC